MAKLGDVCEILDSKRVPITASNRKAGIYPYYGANGIQDYVDDYLFDDELVLLAEDGGHFGSTEKPIAYRVSGKCWVNNHAHVLKPKDGLDVDYLCYSLMFRDVTNIVNGATRQKLTQADMKQIDIFLPSIDEQHEIVDRITRIFKLISLRKQQLLKLDEIVKSRFIELFGDPITNSKNLPTERMELRFNLKAGITTATENIHNFEEGKFEVPCYGGNGIRGYVEEKSYSGNYPIIGRQGALCGNVQYATGDFHATEHAVLVSLLKDDNTIWVYYLLKLMDLFRFHTGAAQPGLAVKTLNTVDVIIANRELQNQFATFVEQTDKSKLAIQQSLEKLETLKKSLMQQYFG